MFPAATVNATVHNICHHALSAPRPTILFTLVPLAASLSAEVNLFGFFLDNTVSSLNRSCGDGRPVLSWDQRNFCRKGGSQKTQSTHSFPTPPLHVTLSPPLFHIPTCCRLSHHLTCLGEWENLWQQEQEGADVGEPVTGTDCFMAVSAIAGGEL